MKKLGHNLYFHQIFFFICKPPHLIEERHNSFKFSIPSSGIYFSTQNYEFEMKIEISKICAIK